METLQNELDLPLPPVDKTLFRKHIQHELNKIRTEVAETCAGSNDVEPVPKSA